MQIVKRLKIQKNNYKIIKSGFLRTKINDTSSIMYIIRQDA